MLYEHSPRTNIFWDNQEHQITQKSRLIKLHHVAGSLDAGDYLQT
ncbi:hypothetical protein Spb1_33330 [Planctopirus ephydatiae]|uniref:Uncharacterized protein n=1 Tax=Planctopirus ephydatiae TaxID=2528019 RepID=A0A518GS24_9PLAN|nr:hypothetical protein Spb1_33330 [Planctopirus ephydatiae]